MPQGLVLGAHLIGIYINDLDEKVGGMSDDIAIGRIWKSEGGYITLQWAEE